MTLPTLRSLAALAPLLCAACDEDARVAAAAERGPLASSPAAPEELEPLLVEHGDGLTVEILERGSGPRATVGDRLAIHFESTLADDGTVVETTYRSGVPFGFTLGEGVLVAGVERGLLGARAGASLRLAVPAALAYGDAGMGSVPPAADLVFDIRVVTVE